MCKYNYLDCENIINNNWLSLNLISLVFYLSFKEKIK